MAQTKQVSFDSPYRPYDTRWLYWEANGGLLDRPRPDYKEYVFMDNIWLEARQKDAQEEFSGGTFCRHLEDKFGNGLSSLFPFWLGNEELALDCGGRSVAPTCLRQRSTAWTFWGVGDLFLQALMVLYDLAYREANAGALRMEWPRIPLPGWSEGDAPYAAGELCSFVARCRELSALLNLETPVAGVTAGTLRPELAAIVVPSTADG